MKKLCAVALLFSLPLGLVLAEEPVDLVMVSKIRDEGFSRSQVMDILWHLTDVAGPRLTGSPGMQRSMEWSRDEMAKWGLKNSKLEPWGEFGRGWSLQRFSIHQIEPYYFPLVAYPKAWTQGTGGVIRAKPVLVDASTPKDLEKYKGKLSGAIVLMPMTRDIDIGFEADARRLSDENLDEIENTQPRRRRGGNADRRAEFRRRRALRSEMDKIFRDEGAAVILEGGFRGEHGTIFVSRGGSYDVDEPMGLPSAVVAAEHYARLLRFVEKDIPVELEIEIGVQVHQDDLQGYNVVAEIPGSDPRLGDQIVMLGGHLDSWHAATGATDNAAGCAVMMEAVRILQKLGVKPRRTIRVALWSGEEQGLKGSRGYVKEHFGDRESMELQPDHTRFSAYYNLDNGTGKIRGVYLQGNAAVKPIFEAYLEPFHDLGASTLAMRNTGGTDHLSFDAVGLPGFQFIQDPVAYSSRTHHTNMDFYDHIVPDDMMQASVIVASFVYHTAMRDEKLPRKALPEPRRQSPNTP
ncbi:MAG: M20/M25/M40 family metallo-hydrolase [Acidobacteriota bacterium]